MRFELLDGVWVVEEDGNGLDRVWDECCGFVISHVESISDMSNGLYTLDLLDEVVVEVV
jgi:hypothetical protein